VTNSQAVSAVSSFPVWKTVRLATQKSADGYRKAMGSIKNTIGYCANDILGTPAFTCAIEETDIDLVVLSGAELGFGEVVEYGAICARARALGLELCSAEIGPALRLAYKDQPEGEQLIIAMHAIIDSGDILRVFGLENGGGLWLSTFRGYPGCKWHPTYRFVFVRPK
jgi:hypothetical protein